MQSNLQAGWTERLSSAHESYELWRASDSEINWSTCLVFNGGQRKEGLLSVVMFLDDKTPLYQIIRLYSGLLKISSERCPFGLELCRALIWRMQKILSKI